MADPGWDSGDRQSDYRIHFEHYQFRIVFPLVRLSWRFAKFSVLREMARFGIHSFTANMAAQLVNQGPPIIIDTSIPPPLLILQLSPGYCNTGSISLGGSALSRILRPRTSPLEKTAKG